MYQVSRIVILQSEVFRFMILNFKLLAHSCTYSIIVEGIILNA